MIWDRKTEQFWKRKTENSSKTRLYLCFLIALLASANLAIANNENIVESIWDFALPSMHLSNIEINAASLEEAWKQISTDFLIRSVLVVSDSSVTNSSFTFKGDRCSGAELLDALCASYRDFMWTTDNNTGVIWFHPKDLALTDILSPKIRIAHDELGVPMQSGILESLPDNIGIVTANRGGTIFKNTFDYPVDLQAGEYAVRDILNASCVANPNKTFYIQIYTKRKPQLTSISSVNLVSDKPVGPRPGILIFWTLEIGKLTDSVPTDEQIVAALANPDPRIRWAAHKYAESMIWHFPFKELMDNSQTQEQALWVCLGAMNLYVRSEEATYIDGIKKMQGISRDFFEKGELNLAVLVALELSRLTEDANALNIVSQRTLTKGALARIKSEINYSARMSKNVRKALYITGSDWMASADPSFRDLDKIHLKATFVRIN